MVARSIAISFCLLLPGILCTSATADRPGSDDQRPLPHPRAIKIAGETGMASVYAYDGDKHAGGTKTANGERVVATAMTAAHKTIPFNTRVRVTNLKNGMSAIVRINNRGPFAKGRIIDLTPAAAAALGFSAQKEGLAPVTLAVLAD